MKKLLICSLVFVLLRPMAAVFGDDPESTDVMGGGTSIEREEDREEDLDRNMLDSRERMEERDNNSSLIIESDKPTEYDGEDYDRTRTYRERKSLEALEKE